MTHERIYLGGMTPEQCKAARESLPYHAVVWLEYEDGEPVMVAEYEDYTQKEKQQ